MYGAFFVVLASAAVDVIYAYIDPRFALSLKRPHRPVLSVRDLSVSFATRQGVVRAVDGLSFDVGTKEVLGIVGESDRAERRDVLDARARARRQRIDLGSVRFEGREILGLSDTEMQSVRGGEVA